MTQTISAVPAAPAAPASGALPVVIRSEGREVRIPSGIADLSSFRHWLLSDDFPELQRICFLNGVLWVDLGMEQLYTHNQVKFALTLGLGTLVEAGDLGQYVPDGMQLTHVGANLSTVPDALFATHEAFNAGRVTESPNAQQIGATELVGTPDMVLEVVSDSSVEKDMVTLPALYQAAGVDEFWRIDARRELRFEIMRLTPTGYAHTQLEDGWWRSDVFGRDFRFAQGANQRGQPRFRLEMR